MIVNSKRKGLIWSVWSAIRREIETIRVLFVLAPVPEWLQIKADKFIALQPTAIAMCRFENWTSRHIKCIIPSWLENDLSIAASFCAYELAMLIPILNCSGNKSSRDILQSLTQYFRPTADSYLHT